jgi:hypothetical protein
VNTGYRLECDIPGLTDRSVTSSLVKFRLCVTEHDDYLSYFHNDCGVITYRTANWNHLAAIGGAADLVASLEEDAVIEWKTTDKPDRPDTF